jgi:hypothetical protein
MDKFDLLLEIVREQEEKHLLSGNRPVSFGLLSDILEEVDKRYKEYQKGTTTPGLNKTEDALDCNNKKNDLIAALNILNPSIPHT